jgi:hypothetical protein
MSMAWPCHSVNKLMHSSEPITKSMKHKYKGLKENKLINKGRKCINIKILRKIKQILWLFRGNPFVLHMGRCLVNDTADCYKKKIEFVIQQSNNLETELQFVIIDICPFYYDVSEE